MNRATLATIAIAAGCFGTPASAHAQMPAADACGEMHLMQSAEEITFVDHGEEGVGPGDQRILRWAVKDLAGAVIGTFYVVTTVLQVFDDGDVAMATGHIVFEHGDIAVAALGLLRDAGNTTESNRTAVTWSITGGTGAFVGATGEVINGPPAEDANDLEHWTLDIFVACP